MKRILDPKQMQKFEFYLRDEERSVATIEKYMRDIRFLASFVGESEITKQMVLEYKSKLGESYAVASANSMIAAMNCFFRFCGWHDLCIKQFKMQRIVYCSEEKELTRVKYFCLLGAAKQKIMKKINLFYSKNMGRSSSCKCSEANHKRICTTR